MYDELRPMVDDAEARATVGDSDDNGIKKIAIEPAILEKEQLPVLPDELIRGIIRKGGKLMISGASKSGKSYLLIELAIAISTGDRWVGFDCAQGRVLYVNLEIQRPQFLSRIYYVEEKLQANKELVANHLRIANLRGAFSDISQLVDSLIDSCANDRYDLVIIDPAYKVQAGHENDADAITLFCGELDRLAESLKCTIAYTHHHSKGAQGAKNAADRASGSGVFARDADALIDMIELESNEESWEAKKLLRYENATPFRLEFVLRDFKQPAPRDIWFTYPTHVVDMSGMLEDCSAKKPGAKTSASDKRKASMKEFEQELDEFMGPRDEADRKAFQEATGKDKRTINAKLAQSTRFELVSDANTAKIRRIRKAPISTQEK